MKLLRYGLAGQEKPAAIDANGEIRDLSEVVPNIAEEVLLPQSIERLKNTDLTILPRVDPKVRIGPCVGKVGKFICVGLNYADHAAEAGSEVGGEARSCVLHARVRRGVAATPGHMARSRRGRGLDAQPDQ